MYGFISCVSRINNTQIDGAQYIDVVTPMYNLIKSNDNYSKSSGILWQHFRDVLTVDNNGAISDFTEANAFTDSFSLKVELTGQTGNNDTRLLKQWYH